MMYVYILVICMHVQNIYKFISESILFVHISKHFSPMITNKIVLNPF
jgi:hypothetical protein